MRRVIVIAVAGASLAGCSSFSMDAFRPAPPTVQVQLESTPPGADARTSIGPGCKTPCSVELQPPENGFSVTFIMNKFQTATVPVQATVNSGSIFSAGSARVDPNPVVAELQPAGPLPKAAHKMMRPKKPKIPKASAAAPADSAFPDNSAPAPAAPQPAAPSR